MFREERASLPGFRSAVSSFVLAGIGPLVMGATSPAAVVVGLRSLGESARSGRNAPGRSTAYVGVAFGIVGMVMWVWVLWRVHTKLGETGKDPNRVIPVAVALGVVWVASASAALVVGRYRRRFG
ncbi:MAG: hypothetical protein QOI81_707 [Actinomycetota bacterium]|nr:hypothetical protein [Actinomycetota bacterium]